LWQISHALSRGRFYSSPQFWEGATALAFHLIADRRPNLEDEETLSYERKAYEGEASRVLFKKQDSTGTLFV